MGLEMITKKKKGNCCREYRIIFLDLEMPGMNGYQTFLEIMKENQESIVIACSGHCSEKEKEKAWTIGFREYLEKPLKKEEVQNILANYLR